MSISSHPIPPSHGANGKASARGGEASSDQAGTDLFSRIASRLQSQTTGGEQAAANTDTAEPLQNATPVTDSPDGQKLAPEILQDAAVVNPDLVQTPAGQTLPGSAAATPPATLPAVAGRPGNNALSTLQALMDEKGLPLDKALQALTKARQENGAGKPVLTMPAQVPATGVETPAPQALTATRPIELPGMLGNGDPQAIRDALQTALFKATAGPGNAANRSEGLVSEATPQLTRSSAADMMAATAPAARADAATHSIKLDVPGSIHQPAWQQNLAERIVFAAGNNIRQAELQIHPAELGPVQIRIEVTQDRASVQMAAMHADTREALDAALPRLREMFNQQGMELLRADVQQQFGNGSQQTSGDSTDAAFVNADSSDVAPGESMPADSLEQSVRRARGLLDLYA